MAWSDAPAVVLAAGEGRRLAPLTNTRPKPMLPVANRPILEYVLEAIADAGIDRVIFIVGYQQERIRNYFGDGDEWDVSIEYVAQAPQLGTGHAVLQVESAVDGPFLVLNGDRVVDPSIVELVRAEAETNGSPVISVTHVEHPSTFGVVDVRNGQLLSIEEKPLDPQPRELINAGVYAFDGDIFDAIRATDPVDGELTLTATLNRLTTDRVVRTVSYRGTWLDVTHLWDLPVVNANRIAGASAADIEGDGAGEGSQGDEVVLGTNVHVGPGATLRGGVSVGDHSVVGAGAVVENSVILHDATIDAGAVIRDAIVGANARVGPNSTVEGGEATVVVEDTVYHDVELGGVIGDNATIGGATVLAPGAVVGDGAVIDSGATVDGWIDPETRVRRG